MKIKMTAYKSFALLCCLSALNLAQAFAPAPHRFTASYGHSSQLSMAAEHQESTKDASPALTSRRGALSTFLATSAAVLSSSPSNANAAESRTIARLQGSGLVFKDTLVVESFDDPKVKGVTLYISNFERPMTERIQKDFFTEPSYASVTAVKTGPIEVADNIDKSDKGEPVFEEKRSLLFKEIRVQRIYDAEKNTLVYVSFNTRLDKNSDSNNSRFKSSVVAIPLN